MLLGHRNGQLVLASRRATARPPSRLRANPWSWESGVSPPDFCSDKYQRKTFSPGKMTLWAMVTYWVGRDAVPGGSAMLWRLLCCALCVQRAEISTGAELKTCSVLSWSIWKMDEREHLHHLLQGSSILHLRTSPRCCCVWMTSFIPSHYRRSPKAKSFFGKMLCLAVDSPGSTYVEISSAAFLCAWLGQIYFARTHCLYKQASGSCFRWTYTACQSVKGSGGG